MDAVSTLSILGGAGAVAMVLLLWRPGKNRTKSVVGERIALNTTGDNVAGDEIRDDHLAQTTDDWEVIPVVPAARSTTHGEAVNETLAVSSLEVRGERVVVLNVMAGNGRSFHGAEVMDALAEVGMEYGDMEIFHYVAEDTGGAPLFSLANALNPGTFDIHAMTDFSTPGLTLFMRLPGPLEDMAALDCMYDIAARLAGLLDGTLCDGQRRPFTADMLDKQRSELLGFYHTPSP